MSTVMLKLIASFAASVTKGWPSFLIAHTTSGPTTQPTAGSTKKASAEKCAIMPQVRSSSVRFSGVFTRASWRRARIPRNCPDVATAQARDDRSPAPRAMARTRGAEGIAPSPQLVGPAHRAADRYAARLDGLRRYLAIPRRLPAGRVDLRGARLARIRRHRMAERKLLVPRLLRRSRSAPRCAHALGAGARDCAQHGRQRRNDVRWLASAALRVARESRRHRPAPQLAGGCARAAHRVAGSGEESHARAALRLAQRARAISRLAQPPHADRARGVPRPGVDAA